MISIKDLLVVAAFLSMPVSAVAGNVIAWPPQERSFDAPQNWPIAHPGPAVDISKIPAAAVFRSLTVKERKAVQSELARLNYYFGKIDGKWGSMTLDATRRYAARVGIESELSNPSGAMGVFRHIVN